MYEGRHIYSPCSLITPNGGSHLVHRTRVTMPEYRTFSPSSLSANLSVALVQLPQHIMMKGAFNWLSLTNWKRHDFSSCPGRNRKEYVTRLLFMTSVYIEIG